MSSDDIISHKITKKSFNVTDFIIFSILATLNDFFLIYYSNSTLTYYFYLYHIVSNQLFYLIFTDYISCKYFEFYNVLKMNSN